MGGARFSRRARHNSRTEAPAPQSSPRLLVALLFDQRRMGRLNNRRRRLIVMRAREKAMERGQEAAAMVGGVQGDSHV